MRRKILLPTLASLILLASAGATLATLERSEPAAMGTGIPGVHSTDKLRFTRSGDVWFPLGFYGGALNQIDNSSPWGGNPETANNYFMDKLAAAHLNFFRAWINWGAISRRNDPNSWDYNQVHPYNRSTQCCATDGGNKFNLDSFNTAYFEMIERQVQRAASLGIVTQLALFDCWHAANPIGDSLPNVGEDYYNGTNNINGADARSGAEWTAGNLAHATLRIKRVAEEQRDFVNKALDYLADEPNVIFETCNENRNNAAFHTFVSGLVKARTTHLVMPTDLPEHRDVAGHRTPADSAQQSISAMHTALITQRGVNQPLITDNDCCTMPYVGSAFSREKAWAALTAGAHSDFFLDGMNMSKTVMDNADVVLGMRQYGYILDALDALDVDLVGMQSVDALVSAGDWALARPSDEFLVYLPAGSASSTTVQQLPTFRTARWINPRNGVISLAERGPTFTQAGTSDWALYVRQEAADIPVGAFIADAFSLAAPNREVGDALNGTTTDVGGRTWTASTDLGMGDGYLTNLTTFNSHVAGVAFGPTDFSQRVAKVQAVVNPTGSEWIGTGLSKSATGAYWSHGQIWAYLRPNGMLQVRANGTAHALYDGFPTSFVAGRNRIELAYDKVDHTVRVWLNGSEIALTAPDLDSFAFTPDILFAGFHAYKTGGFAAANTIAIDDFAVSLSGGAVHNLIASYVPSALASRTETTISTTSSSTLNFHYDESLGNFEQRVGGACYDGYENPAYFKVRYSGDSFDSCTFQGNFDASPITCSAAQAAALQAGTELTIATDDYGLSSTTCRRLSPLVPRALPNTNLWFELKVTKAGLTTTRRVNFRKTSPNPSTPYMRLIARYRTSATSAQQEMISSLPAPPSFGYFYKQSTGSFEQRPTGACNNGANNPTYLRILYEGTTFDSCTYQLSVNPSAIACPAFLVADLMAGAEIILNTDELKGQNPGVCPPQFTTTPNMRQGEQHWVEIKFTKAGVTTTRRLNFSRTNAPQ